MLAERDLVLIGDRCDVSVKGWSRPLLRAELLERYVEFVAARCRPNTVIATVSDLRAHSEDVAESVGPDGRDLVVGSGSPVAGPGDGRSNGARAGCVVVR